MGRAGGPRTARPAAARRRHGDGAAARVAGYRPGERFGDAGTEHCVQLSSSLARHRQRSPASRRDRFDTARGGASQRSTTTSGEPAGPGTRSPAADRRRIQCGTDAAPRAACTSGGLGRTASLAAAGTAGYRHHE